MSLVDRIREFRPPDFSRLRPFRIAGETLGWVRKPFAEALRRFPETFAVAEHEVALLPHLAAPDARSDAVDKVLRALHADGIVPKIRGERFAVANRFGDTPRMTLDRAAVTLFGTRAFGIHVNGHVGEGDAMQLWIGRRARDKAVAPGKLDNLVAGGQPDGLGLTENLLKEAREEAGIGEDLARTARPTGYCSYLIETGEGIRNDLLFTYDLAVDAGFVPHNTDGEIEDYRLMPIAEIMRRTAETQDFKFNVALVNIDFMVRHGFVTPDDPDYLEIVAGLRR
jgi:8-oxo-dGTP pyrophosphatase MutT (NUDIX family)